MGKTRDLFRKIRDTKGTFHAKMGTIKDRNGMDLAEDIIGGKNTQKKNYEWRFITLYRRQWSKASPRKINAKRRNVCLRMPYK